MTITVPQGSKVNELRAIVRKHRSEILGDSLSASGSSAFDAATSNVENVYSQATDRASLASEEAFNQAVNFWSESRLKAYLDARGIVCACHPSPPLFNSCLLTICVACPPWLKD